MKPSKFNSHPVKVQIFLEGLPQKSSFCDLLRKFELYWSGAFGSMWTSLEIANTAD